MKSLFLTAYGLSINVKNTRVVLKQGINDPFSNECETIELPTSACPFDKVIIQGKGYVSTEALQILADIIVNVMMLGKRGKLFSYFNQIRGSDRFIRIFIGGDMPFTEAIFSYECIVRKIVTVDYYYRLDWFLFQWTHRIYHWQDSRRMLHSLWQR